MTSLNASPVGTASCGIAFPPLHAARWKENPGVDPSDRGGHRKELAATGHLARLWRPVGESRSIGVWRADDEHHLHEKVLGTLSLRPWMTLTVTALESHPNDPGGTGATP
ncbi:muconolactone Delta-isomerase family protein [Streptomyces griseoflavus]|uniref:muconolactone Delta-isomerase family protein n=1 Tax=Streptomyces griseoflavus TaxID=35619 RepID=UPI001FCBF134|nr:muconolactone Delta-isomerase family protein [Streptomyces griseoflavus]